MCPQPVSASETPNTGTSTGPRTAQGKAVSSQNALKHGLASETMIMRGESAQDWEEFRDSMFAEWQPGTPTEQALVGDMAKHQWLKDRAIRLQNELFEFYGLDAIEKSGLAVLMRYQTTNERAFARAKKQLDQMLKNRRPEFVSQNETETAETVAACVPKRPKVRQMPSTEEDSLEKIDRDMNEFFASLGIELPAMPNASEVED